MKKTLFAFGCVLLGFFMLGAAKPAPTPEEDEIISNLELLQNYDLLIQLDFFEKYDAVASGGKEKIKGEQK